VRLEVDALSFGYPDRTVGRDVSFALEAGEVLCWLGPNGGGKTTLFRTILGLLEPQGGQVRVDGEAIAGWPRGRRAQAFGYVPQAQLGAFPFTVHEAVLMGRTAHLGLFATPTRHDHDVAADALVALGIDRLRNRRYTEISGGERQLALIARALAQEPRILVMDEPTANLDFGNRVRVLGHVEALAARGIAVMLSTHDPDQAFLCAHRTAVLHGGRLAALGAPTDVITPTSLRALYGVEVDVVVIPGEGGRSARVCVPSLGGREPGGPAGG
jgi:iron complex transport system ATP-binding protein